MLTQALKNLSRRCKQILPVKGLSDQVSSLRFYDGRTSDSPDANIKWSDVVPGAVPKTMYAGGQHVAAVSIVRPNGDGTYSSTTTFDIGNQWNVADQSAVLVHEGMHPLTHMTDSQLWDFAKANGAVPSDQNHENDSNPSTSFTNWIKAGCPDQSKK